MRRSILWLPALCLFLAPRAYAADAPNAPSPGSSETGAAPLNPEALDAQPVNAPSGATAAEGSATDASLGVGSDADSDERQREENLKLPLGLTEDPKIDQPALVQPKLDTVAGHFALAGGVSWLVPFGALEQGLDSSARLSQGHAFAFDLSFGVSRTVAIGGFGRLTSFGAPDACPSCSASGYVLGPFVRYHLVQGTRFDPWLLAGAGYRTLSIEDKTSTSDYSGFEWLHLVVGGDWYATNLIGIGPWAELNAGTFGTHANAAVDSATHVELSLGFRLILDVPGK